MDDITEETTDPDQAANLSNSQLIQEFESGLSKSFSLIKHMSEDERAMALQTIQKYLKPEECSSSSETETSYKPQTSLETKNTSDETGVDVDTTVSSTQLPVFLTSGGAAGGYDPDTGYEEFESIIVPYDDDNGQVIGGQQELINLRIFKLEDDYVQLEDIEAGSDMSRWKTIKKEKSDPEVVETIRVVVGPGKPNQKLQTQASRTQASRTHARTLRTEVQNEDEGEEVGETVVYYGGLPISERSDFEQKLTESKRRLKDTNSTDSDQEKHPDDITKKDFVRRKGHDVKKTAENMWECGTCDKFFKVKAAAIGHLRVHTREKPFPCSMCEKSFSVQANRSRHMRDVHHCKPQLLCNLCMTIVASRQALTKHMKIAHNLGSTEEADAYECKECEKKYVSRSSYTSHLRQVHETPSEGYRCKVCQRRFNFQSNLIRHMKIHTGDRPHECQHCEAAFIEKRSLFIHLVRVHDCTRTKTLLEFDSRFSCEECHKVFTTKGNLLAHQRVHTKETPHQCSYCTRSFSLKSNLKRHERTHRGERPFMCPTCRKCFGEKRSLAIHLRTHTGERPYKCEKCDKDFAQLSTLQSHLPVHDRERSFLCKKCPETFLRRSHLSVHMRKHRMENLLQCKFCEFSTYNRAEMMKHASCHIPSEIYSCEDCDETFESFPELEFHMRSHSGEGKLFSCQVCQQVFPDFFTCHDHQQTAHPDVIIPMANSETVEFDEENFVLMPTDDIQDELFNKPDYAKSHELHEPQTANVDTTGTNEVASTSQTQDRVMTDARTLSCDDLQSAALTYKKLYVVPANGTSQKENYFFLVK